MSRTRRARNPARLLRDFARAGAVLAGLLLGASAQDGEARVAAERLLYADAKALLAAESAEVRGEAALVVASLGDPRSYQDLLAVARDADEQARLPSILALGFLSAPGTAPALSRILEQEAGRSTPTAVCAAYALAALPKEQGDGVLADFLSRASEHSWKRQRDVVLAALAALVDRDCDGLRAVLLRLQDDASLRDPTIRAAVLLALARIPGATTDAHLDAALRSADDDLRYAGLLTLSARDDPATEQIALATRMAQRDPSTTVRAAALQTLTARRHLPALDLAARSLRSPDARLVAQAVRTAQTLGGEPMRRTLERQFDFLPLPAQRALLSELATPLTDEFAGECRKLLSDPTTDSDLRAELALLLSRNGDSGCIDPLFAAFARSTEPAQQLELARAYARAADGDPKALLAVAAEDSPHAASRLSALLRSGSASASRFCMERLCRPELPPGQLAVLRAIRSSRLPQLGDEARNIAPAVVRDLLTRVR